LTAANNLIGIEFEMDTLHIWKTSFYNKR